MQRLLNAVNFLLTRVVKTGDPHEQRDASSHLAWIKSLEDDMKAASETEPVIQDAIFTSEELPKPSPADSAIVTVTSLDPVEVDWSKVIFPAPASQEQEPVINNPALVDWSKVEPGTITVTENEEPVK